jgi:hypothetical protein
VGIDPRWKQTPLAKLHPEHAKCFLELALLHAPTPEEGVAEFLTLWADVLKDRQSVMQRLHHENAEARVSWLREKRKAAAYISGLRRRHEKGQVLNMPERFQSDYPPGDVRRASSFLLHLIGTALVLADLGQEWFSHMRKFVEMLSDDDMPPEEREYTINFLSFFERAMRERPRRSAGRQDIAPERDQLIKCTVDLVAAELKLKPTRNRATRDVESACSIVAKALKKLEAARITESSVNDIYRRQTRG